jgi:hypothetical protein
MIVGIRGDLNLQEKLALLRLKNVQQEKEIKQLTFSLEKLTEVVDTSSHHRGIIGKSFCFHRALSATYLQFTNYHYRVCGISDDARTSGKMSQSQMGEILAD